MPNTQPNSQKAILELMATYNQSANKAMIEVLEELDESELEKDRGLYFKSILGTMVHFTAADATFFKDYFAGFCKVDSSGENSCASTPNANKIEAMLESPFSLKPEIANDATNLFAAREEIDSYILQVVANIEDFSAVRELAFPWGAMSKPVYQFIFGILNHGTHHRGMIASVLDTLKIENDFNGALGI